MTEIRSRSVHVATSADTLKTHLQDLRNLEAMLPQDQGGLEIRLTRVGTAFEGSTLRLQGGGAPFAFHLDLHVEEAGDGAKAGVVCEADLNPFMKMMAQKPLEALFQHIAGAVEARFGAA